MPEQGLLLHCVAVSTLLLEPMALVSFPPKTIKKETMNRVV